jgi:palmitoyl-protein thioesterase
MASTKTLISIIIILLLLIPLLIVDNNWKNIIKDKLSFLLPFLNDEPSTVNAGDGVDDDFMTTSNPLGQAFDWGIFKQFTNEIENSIRTSAASSNNIDITHPTILVHGMGDSCFNPGFSSLTDLVGSISRQPAICIPAGDTLESDTTNTFVLNMNIQVEQFAKAVKSDPRLANGMNAIGLSQGNLVIRAYIQLINDPPILSFISVHGPQAGVGGLPRCNPMKGMAKYICDFVDTVLGELAYNSIVQNALSQANFFRDPQHIAEYLQSCVFLPKILDQVPAGSKQRDNLLKLKHLVLILAERDTMIIPRDSEWFSAFEDGDSWQHQKVIAMESCPWYKTLGLDVLKSSGRLHQLTTKGDHLQFSRTELTGWISTYFV